MGAHPDWTPDGRIVFHEWDLCNLPELDRPANMFVVDAERRAARAADPLHRSRVPAAQTRVAPDGLGVVFTRVEGPGWAPAAWPTWHSAKLSRAGSHPSRRAGHTPRSGRVRRIGRVRNERSASDQRIAGKAAGGERWISKRNAGRPWRGGGCAIHGRSRSPAPSRGCRRTQPASARVPRSRYAKGCNRAPDRCWARDNSLSDPGQGPPSVARRSAPARMRDGNLRRDCR